MRGTKCCKLTDVIQDVPELTVNRFALGYVIIIFKPLLSILGSTYFENTINRLSHADFDWKQVSLIF